MVVNRRRQLDEDVIVGYQNFTNVTTVVVCETVTVRIRINGSILDVDNEELAMALVPLDQISAYLKDASSEDTFANRTDHRCSPFTIKTVITTAIRAVILRNDSAVEETGGADGCTAGVDTETMELVETLGLSTSCHPPPPPPPPQPPHSPPAFENDRVEPIGVFAPHSADSECSHPWLAYVVTAHGFGYAATRMFADGAALRNWVADHDPWSGRRRKHLATFSLPRRAASLVWCVCLLLVIVMLALLAIADWPWAGQGPTRPPRWIVALWPLWVLDAFLFIALAKQRKRSGTAESALHVHDLDVEVSSWTEHAGLPKRSRKPKGPREEPVQDRLVDRTRRAADVARLLLVVWLHVAACLLLDGASLRAHIWIRALLVLPPALVLVASDAMLLKALERKVHLPGARLWFSAASSFQGGVVVITVIALLEPLWGPTCRWIWPLGCAVVILALLLVVMRLLLPKREWSVGDHAVIRGFVRHGLRDPLEGHEVILVEWIGETRRWKARDLKSGEVVSIRGTYLADQGRERERRKQEQQFKVSKPRLAPRGGQQADRRAGLTRPLPKAAAPPPAGALPGDCPPSCPADSLNIKVARL